MSTNRKEHLRYRYGICLNETCSKCKSKDVQQIPARKELVCEECQKPLRECPPPKSFWDKYGKMIIGAIVVVVAAIIVLLFVFPSSDSEESATDTVVTEGVDVSGQVIIEEPATITENTDSANTVKEVEDTVMKETPAVSPQPTTEPQPATPTSSIKVPFGTYSGPASGLDGEIKVTRSYTLDLRNAAHETIELLPGDVITRTKFKNGELVSGYWRRGSESRSFHR